MPPADRGLGTEAPGALTGTGAAAVPAAGRPSPPAGRPTTFVPGRQASLIAAYM